MNVEEYEAQEKVLPHPFGDHHPESCVTSHYAIRDCPIDVRLDGRPIVASATWCSRHDQWSSSCAFNWQVRALKAEEALREIAKGAGPYSRDPLEHARSTIEAMKSLAKEALKE
jgi:hypothetical protein